MVIIVVETYLGRGGLLGLAVAVPGRVAKVIVGSAQLYITTVIIFFKDLGVYVYGGKRRPDINWEAPEEAA